MKKPKYLNILNRENISNDDVRYILDCLIEDYVPNVGIMDIDLYEVIRCLYIINRNFEEKGKRVGRAYRNSLTENNAAYNYIYSYTLEDSNVKKSFGKLLHKRESSTEVYEKALEEFTIEVLKYIKDHFNEIIDDLEDKPLKF